MLKVAISVRQRDGGRPAFPGAIQIAEVARSRGTGGNER